MVTLIELFVRFVERPAPHIVIHGFIIKVLIVLGILTTNEGFVIYVEIVLGIFTLKDGFTTNVEIVLGIFTLKDGFTTNVEMVLGSIKFALNVLIVSELKLTGFVTKVDITPQISTHLLVEILV